MECQFFALLLILLIMVSSVKGVSIKFAAYPPELKANLTDNASMHCDVSNAASNDSTDLQHIVSMFITRNEGEEIASITPFAAPLVLKDIGNLELKGSISSDPSGLSTMELVWKNPSLMTLGEYRCKVTGTDSQGHTVDMESGLEISTVTPTMLDVIQYFKTKEMSQNLLIEKQRAENSRLQSQLDIQAMNLTKLQQNCQTCSNSIVAFTASLGPESSHEISFSSNRVVIFDKVTLNEGSDYNPSTGLFVCRQPGLYLFNVHANSYDRKGVCLQIQLNAAATTSLDAAAYQWHGSASASATLRLKAGDVVRVMTSCDSHFFESGLSTYTNTFTGVLIQGDLCGV